MSAMQFFILTADDRLTAMGWNGAVSVNPRQIDGPVSDELVGRYVAPARIADDPDYALHAPEMLAFLLTLPRVDLDPALIFAPPEE